MKTTLHNIRFICFSLFTLFALTTCKKDESGNTTIKTGSWYGENIAFTVSDHPLRLYNIEFSYSYTSCSTLHESSASFAESIDVSDNDFNKNINLYNISGTFISDSTAEVTISWSGHDSDCDVDYSGSRTYTAGYNLIGK